MQITLTGHNIEVTDAIRDFTNNKFEKIFRHVDRITSVNVTFSKENHDQIAEATVHVPGSELHARSSAENLYAAIDGLIDKLDRQIIKHKEKQH